MKWVRRRFGPAWKAWVWLYGALVLLFLFAVGFEVYLAWK